MMSGIPGATGSRRPTAFGRLVPPDPDWLGLQRPEPILFADLPIIDAHHHLWEAPGLSSPGFRYMLDDYMEDAASGHNVIGTVYADCMSMYRAAGPEHHRPVGETEFALGAGAMSRSGRYGPVSVAAGIFGYADLELGAAVEDVLVAHVEAGNGRFKGVRYAANWDPDSTILNYQPNRRAHLLADPKVLDGLRTLAALGLTYDSLAWFTQLDEVAAAADAVPNLSIIVNHCGGPLGYGPYAGREVDNFARWKAGILQLAQRPNVVCKIGGVLMRGAAYDFIHAAVPPTSEELAKAWRRWFETCIEAFGPERCMFESNFPLEKLGTGFAVLWNAFKRIAANASEQERRDLFAGTARRVYRLDI